VWEGCESTPQANFSKILFRNSCLSDICPFCFWEYRFLLCSFQVVVNPMTSFLHLKNNAPYHAPSKLQILYVLSIILHLKYFASFNDKVFLNPAATHRKFIELSLKTTTSWRMAGQEGATSLRRAVGSRIQSRDTTVIEDASQIGPTFWFTQRLATQTPQYYYMGHVRVALFVWRNL